MKSICSTFTEAENINKTEAAVVTLSPGAVFRKTFSDAQESKFLKTSEEKEAALSQTSSSVDVLRRERIGEDLASGKERFSSLIPPSFLSYAFSFLFYSSPLPLVPPSISLFYSFLLFHSFRPSYTSLLLLSSFLSCFVYPSSLPILYFPTLSLHLLPFFPLSLSPPPTSLFSSLSPSSLSFPILTPSLSFPLPSPRPLSPSPLPTFSHPLLPSPTPSLPLALSHQLFSPSLSHPLLLSPTPSLPLALSHQLSSPQLLLTPSLPSYSFPVPLPPTPSLPLPSPTLSSSPCPSPPTLLPLTPTHFLPLPFPLYPLLPSPPPSHPSLPSPTTPSSPPSPNSSSSPRPLPTPCLSSFTHSHHSHPLLLPRHPPSNKLGVDAKDSPYL
ncbi:hypothetical protein C7M84_013747 [Penaeus vannamei]|uniref:Uncharacterized protein n=1 Tax=Penaeus vannamei TaxID=6689 RepID=A0A423SVB0_PENVA|nr:hypothetical protein C7M84_013747 [Penaeus vannamei]